MKILNKTAAVLCFAAILTLSACDKSDRSSTQLAKDMVQVAEQEKQQAPEKRHQAMLEELNVTHYRNFDGDYSDIYTFEIDGVKCIAIFKAGLSCDYNDEHIAKNLAAKEKRLAAKAAAQNNQLEQITEAQLEVQRQQRAGR